MDFCLVDCLGGGGGMGGGSGVGELGGADCVIVVGMVGDGKGGSAVNSSGDENGSIWDIGCFGKWKDIFIKEDIPADKCFMGLRIIECVLDNL
nr:hypothetical protein [Tanacetum cinerariifolium]